MRAFFVIFFGFCALLSFSQQEATTVDGKRILLYPDGTWKPVSKIETLDLVQRNISHLELPKAKLQDQIIKHIAYTLSYNSTHHIANWVAYELTAEETVSIVKRNDHFVPDLMLSSGSVTNEDYKGSGYDRGHLAPSADMCFSQQTMEESFYLSNMSPQNPGFNRGIWSKLESQVRQWANDERSVFVVTGTVLSKGLPTLGYNRITIPGYFYKVILDYTEPEIKGIGFILPNEGSPEPLQKFALTIDSVEKLTGYDFFYQIPDDQEKVFESSIDIHKWSWTSTKKNKSEQVLSQSQQCQGVTKARIQCKNKTTNNNGYCYVHQSQAVSTTTPSNAVQPKSSKRTISIQCSAITKKRTQCSRMTYSPNGKCWQHAGD